MKQSEIQQVRDCLYFLWYGFEKRKLKDQSMFNSETNEVESLAELTKQAFLIMEKQLKQQQLPHIAGKWRGEWKLRNTGFKKMMNLNMRKTLES